MPKVTNRWDLNPDVPHSLPPHPTQSCYVALANLELVIWARLTLNSSTPPVCLLRTG